MASLSREMNLEIRETLKECAELLSPATISDLFLDNRISPWKFSLPTRNNLNMQVNAYIAFLVGKQRADTQENALALFLQVLSDNLDANDHRINRLQSAANALSVELKGENLSTQTRQNKPSPGTFPYYKKGLKFLLKKLEAIDQLDYRKALSLEDRLKVNLASRELHGAEPANDVERSKIIEQLNDLALTHIKTSFNEICEIESAKQT